MKFLGLSIVLSFFAVSAQASSYFTPFMGAHKVIARYCDEGDVLCENLDTVEVAHLSEEYKNCIIETYKDTTRKTLWMWEGKQGKEETLITGSFGKSVFWTYFAFLNTGVSHEKSVSLDREFSTSPVWYTYKESRYGGNEKPINIARRFKLTP